MRAPRSRISDLGCSSRPVSFPSKRETIMAKHASIILQASFAIAASLLYHMSLASAGDTSGSVVQAAMLPPAVAQTASAAVKPGTFDAAVPKVRDVEAVAISGGDADPEIFDRQGLETWWRHYLQMRQAKE
jgi:hypothetical protein